MPQRSVAEAPPAPGPRRDGDVLRAELGDRVAAALTYEAVAGLEDYAAGVGRVTTAEARLVLELLEDLDEETARLNLLLTRSAWPKCVVCSRPFASSEAAAGFKTCERCQLPAGAEDMA
jgi:hypothetical protein